MDAGKSNGEREKEIYGASEELDTAATLTSSSALGILPEDNDSESKKKKKMLELGKRSHDAAGIGNGRFGLSCAYPRSESVLLKYMVGSSDREEKKSKVKQEQQSQGAMESGSSGLSCSQQATGSHSKDIQKQSLEDNDYQENKMEQEQEQRDCEQMVEEEKQKKKQ